MGYQLARTSRAYSEGVLLRPFPPSLPQLTRLQYAEFGLTHFGTDTVGVNKTRRYLCEALSFQYRYIPIGLLERLPAHINERAPAFQGRDELGTSSPLLVRRQPTRPRWRRNASRKSKQPGLGQSFRDVSWSCAGDVDVYAKAQE